MENLALSTTPPPAHLLASAALRAAPSRAQAVPRMARWRGPGLGLPIGAPSGGRAPLVSPMLFGGK
ncbi:hypothetical protein NHH82_20955 [Oxalobacteraceae bacterium OTU3REALA1]|nr:hypothetical protein NHH82_20955 [Oxalobacteraceae bacterium OTU3REALA1]